MLYNILLGDGEAGLCRSQRLPLIAFPGFLAGMDFFLDVGGVSH